MVFDREHRLEAVPTWPLRGDPVTVSRHETACQESGEGDFLAVVAAVLAMGRRTVSGG